MTDQPAGPALTCDGCSSQLREAWVS